MLATIPLPLPDQTLLSLVALGWMQNPLGPWVDAGRTFLGNSFINLRALAHSGVCRVFREMESAGYDRPEDLLQSHCHLPLIRPFVDPIQYAHCVKVMMNDEPGRLAQLSRHNVINERHMYCSSCVDVDHREHGFAYSRRAHQVTGVSVCHKHGEVLQSLASDCDDKYATRGILVATCSSHSTAWRLERRPASGSAYWAQRYSEFVSATLAGELEVIDAQTRRQSYVRRIQDRHPQETSLGAALSRDLEASVGQAALRELGLDFRSGWSAQWPWLILDGATFADFPIFNLVTIATLFDSVSDYHQACRDIDPAPTRRIQSKTAHVAVPREIALSKSMIRDLLREPSLRRVAEKHGISLPTITQRLSSFPALAQRRPAALRRRSARNARLALQRFVSQHPHSDRKEFKAHHIGAYSRLMRFDRAWFESTLPSSRKCKKSSHDRDLAVASNITTLTIKLLTGSNEHLRRTWKHLLSLLEQPLPQRPRLGHLPTTSTVVLSFVETQGQHIDRCKAHLQALLDKGDGVEAKRWAQSVAKSYPRYAKLITEQLNGQTWAPPTPRTLQQQMARRRKKVRTPDALA